MKLGGGENSAAHARVHAECRLLIVHVVGDGRNHCLAAPFQHSLPYSPHVKSSTYYATIQHSTHDATHGYAHADRPDIDNIRAGYKETRKYRRRLRRDKHAPPFHTLSMTHDHLSMLTTHLLRGAHAVALDLQASDLDVNERRRQQRDPVLPAFGKRHLHKARGRGGARARASKEVLRPHLISSSS